MHFNEHSDFYYRHVHGDKETFHLAWRKLAQDYAMPERPIHALEATMCQHDFQGRRIFQHRNFDKWRVTDDNRRIHGFLHEAQCFEFVDDLRIHWHDLPRGVRRWRPESKTPAEISAAERLCAQPWRYRRVGHDERPLTFRTCGRIGEGANDRERLWDLRAVGDRIFVEIFAHYEKTLAAELLPDGIWRGRWVVYEQMPVELVPVVAGEEFLSTATTGTGNHRAQHPINSKTSQNNKQLPITNS